MKVNMRRLGSTLFGLFMLASFLISVDTARAQNATTAPVTLAQMPLENMRIKAQSISDLLSRLALRYDIPIGLEVARPGNLSSFHRLEFRKGTPSDLLTQFIAEHDEYAWKIEDGVVSIFPRDAYRDPLVNRLLATEINHFSVAKGTVTWSVSKNLFATPEIQSMLEPFELKCGMDGFSGFFFPQLGKEFSFSVSRMSLKSILDKIVKESPAAKFWTLSNNYSDESVTLIVDAGFEYAPEDRYLKDVNIDDLIDPWP